MFKAIIEEMDEMDKDTGLNMAKRLHLTRKQFYLLVARFTIVLYEFDSYYAERIDFILDKVTKQHDKFYIDELANPINWAPNRSAFVASQYFALRNYDDNRKLVAFYVTKNDDGTLNFAPQKLKKE